MKTIKFKLVPEELRPKFQKNVLILTVGLPRSGKSTWAKQQGYPIVNPDSIRLALYNKPFITEAESMVWAITHYMVHSLFLAGHTTVILDATNITKERRDKWVSPNKPQIQWKRVFKVFNSSANTCINRAIRSNREDLVGVIVAMDVTYEPLHKSELER